MANINDQMLVRLTPCGRERLRFYCSCFEQANSGLNLDEVVNSLFETQPDGRNIFQIWQAMNIFGPDCFNGSSRLPFVDNKIEFLAS